MKTGNKKAIIITSIVMFIGVLLILTGLFGERITGLFLDEFDYQNINPEDLGKNIKTDIQVYYDDIDLPDKTLQLVGDMDGDYRFIALDLSALSEKQQRAYYSGTMKHLTISGILRSVDDDEFEEIAQSMYRLYDYLYYESDRDMTLDEFHGIMMEPVIPYCIEVTSVISFSGIPFILIGALIIILALPLLICFVFKLKKKIVLPIVYGLMLLVPSILLFSHIRTVLSVHKVADGFYTMNNLECTDTEGMLDSGAATVNDLLEWIFDNHLYGAPNLYAGMEINYGCAAFAAVSPEGDHLFGRNFDLLETDALLIHSNPDGAYESIGIADLAVLGVSGNDSISPDSFLGRSVMIMTPYVIVDGINEAGVGAGILQLNLEETHQDDGKPDLLVFCAIRAILDNCATVDEALELLGSYDIHSGLDADYHLFITDRTGRYVVVEWLDNETTVTEHPCCTNSVVAPGKYYDMGDPDSRLGTIEEKLGSDLIVSESEAMAILDAVHNRQGMTEWSCVYNLDDFSVSICLDSDYEKVYTFSGSGLG